MNQRSLRLIIARTPSGLRCQCDSNGRVPPSPVDSVGHRHAAALASGAGHGVRVGVSDNPPTRSPSHWQTEPGLTRRMTVRTVPLSCPNPVPETSESLGLETQNLSRREAIHNAVRGHAARRGRSPSACALRVHALNVSIRTTVRTNTGKDMPVHTNTYAAPLRLGPAAPIRVLRGGQKGHRTRAVPSGTKAPNIKGRRRFTAEWLCERPPLPGSQYMPSTYQYGHIRTNTYKYVHDPEPVRAPFSAPRALRRQK